MIPSFVDSGTSTASTLVKKLQGYAALDHEDVARLESVVRNVRTVPARTDLIREGTKSTTVHLILEGFACRCKSTAEGRRQIMAYLVPGDFCDIHAYVLEAMDHTVATLSSCDIVELTRDDIGFLMERPQIALSLWIATMVDAAVLREWLLNIGQRPAEAGLAHVLCELLFRLGIVGLVDGGYELPLTQIDLADTIGTSAVHLNRVLQFAGKN